MCTITPEWPEGPFKVGKVVSAKVEIQ